MAPLIFIFLAMAMGISHSCTATEWVVYPVSSTNVTKLSRITRSLTLAMGKRNAQAYRSTIRKTTEFWLVQAKNAQKAQISQLPFVKAVYENSIVVENCGRTYEKATRVVNATEPDVAPSNAPLRWQTDASPDLNIVSWPPRKRIWADSKPVSQGLGLTAGSIKPLLAVGAVTLTGAQAPFSQGVKESQLRWAPGEQVTCAGGYLSPEQVYADGTSFAASMVAGLAAYTMSQGDWSNPLDLESKLRTRKIYSNDRENNPEVVWNGLNGAAKDLQDVSISQSSSGRLKPLLNYTASA